MLPLLPIDTLNEIGEVLGVDRCWYYRDAYHFRLDEDWTVSVRAESAERWRVETCYLTQPRDRKWCLKDDRERLTSLVRNARDEVAAWAVLS